MKYYDIDEILAKQRVRYEEHLDTCGRIPIDKTFIFYQSRINQCYEIIDNLQNNVIKLEKRINEINKVGG